MHLVTVVPLIVALVGCAIYLLARPERPKIAELGRLMFACGLLVFLLFVGREPIEIRF